MSKRGVQQQKVIAYALLRGKLVPRDEVLRQGLGLAEENSQRQADNFDEMSAKELKSK